MAGQPSFDVTSTVDVQEVENAVNQAKKEIAQRYDFKGSKSSIDFKRAENVIDLVADDTFKMEAVWDILQTRLVRRGVPIKNLKPTDPEPIAGGLVRRTVTLQQGIPEFTGPGPDQGRTALPITATMRTPDPENVHRGYIQSWNAAFERRRSRKARQRQLIPVDQALHPPDTGARAIFVD